MQKDIGISHTNELLQFMRKLSISNNYSYDHMIVMRKTSKFGNVINFILILMEEDLLSPEGHCSTKMK